MKDVVVILNAQEVAVAQQFCATLPDYEVFLFDPVLGDPAIVAKLRNVQLFTDFAAPSYRMIDGEAHAAARALEEALDAAQMSRSGVSILAWQHVTLSYLFLTLRWYTALWQSVGARFAGRRVHVPVNQNFADYYFDSFVPASTLIEYLRGRGIHCVAYDYGAGGVPLLDGVPDLTGEPPGGDPPGGEPPGGGPPWLLTHLPTCIYDHAYFGQELRATGKRIVNLRARRWDVPVEADQTIGLTPMTRLLTSLPPAIQERIASACGALSENLEPLLVPQFGSPMYRARQAESIVDLYRAQFVTYFGLQRYFSTHVPAKLVLSEHDTGFHGPLMSFAESRAMPVVLVPHSKIMGDVEFGYRNVVALTHPMQGTSIHDGYDRPVTSHTIAYPESFCTTSEIGNGLRAISLLLNAVSLNGVHFAPPDVYLDGIKQIVAWCLAHDVHLKIRPRPGFGLLGLLSAAVGADPAVLTRNVAETMDEHVRDCDLCLMYDMPTTGSLFFLRRSLPVLNPIVAELTKQQRSLVHPDLIVPESVAATLRRLDGFREDPLALYAFRTAQFHAYITGFSRARPLRVFL